MAELLTHSPLGGSGAHCFLVCTGSANMSKGLVDEESDFATLGLAAHFLAKACLVSGNEPWQYMGAGIVNDCFVNSDDYDEDDPVLSVIDREMVIAVSEYLELIQLWHPDRNQGNSWTERRFHCPSLHELMYGTSDLTFADFERRTLHVWDYKHGAGILVEAPHNPQGMYYAAGIIEDLMLWGQIDTIVIHIVQPRGWHMDGAHRTWQIDVGDLRVWLGDVLIPGMDKAMTSRDVNVGEHCRFCPARGAQCPAIMKLLVELEEILIMAQEEGARALTPEQIGRILELKSLAQIIFKAAERKAHGKLQAGKEIPGAKLVMSSKNRIYKKGNVEAAAKKKLGAQCMTKPTLKSPAQLDALPGGKDFTARWAYKPLGATTVALESDPRRPVKRDLKSLFSKKEKVNG